MLELSDQRLDPEIREFGVAASENTLSCGAPVKRTQLSPPAFREISNRLSAWKNLLAGSATVRLKQSLGEGENESEATPEPELTLSILQDYRVGPSSGLRRLSFEYGSVKLDAHLRADTAWAELTEPAFDLLPLDLKTAIASHVTANLRQALATWLSLIGLNPAGLPIELVPESLVVCDRESSAEIVSSFVSVSLSLDGNKTTQRAIVDLASLTYVPKHTQEIRPKRLTDPRMSLELLLARVHLKTVDIRALRIGSVVILAVRPAAEQAISCQVMAYGQIFGIATISAADSAQAVFHAVTHQQMSVERRKNEMSNHQIFDGSTARDVLSSLDIPVEAVLELPTVRVSEIQRWAEGTVLTTSSPVDSCAVKVRAGGREIGRGRLVSVEGLLGLEVLELFD